MSKRYGKRRKDLYRKKRREKLQTLILRAAVKMTTQGLTAKEALDTMKLGRFSYAAFLNTLSVMPPKMSYYNFDPA